jgi:hypothetical protein
MAKAKSKPKASPQPKAKGPSKIALAVEYMEAEIKKLGGFAKLERGARKALCIAAAKKFELAEATCATQWQKQIVSK